MSTDPRKLLEAVADVLLALPSPGPELVSAGELLRTRRFEISQTVTAKLEKDPVAATRFLDAVRCLKAISAGFVGEDEEQFAGAGGGGGAIGGALSGGERGGYGRAAFGEVGAEGAGAGDRQGAAVQNLLTKLMLGKVGGYRLSFF